MTPELREDHADDLGHWLTVLKEDKRAILIAPKKVPQQERSRA